MPTTNEAIEDALARRYVFLLRYGGGLARQLIDHLDEAERDVLDQIERRIARLGPLDRQEFGRGRWTTQRLIALRDQLRTQRQQLTAALNETTRDELAALARDEIQFSNAVIAEAVGVDFGILRPSPEQLRALATGGTIRGQTIRQWVRDLSDDSFRRIEQATRMGVIEGQTSRQIAARVQDSLQTSRRSAEMLARTSVNAVSNQARSLLYEANSDIIKAVRWVSTLDSRTSQICMARDGKTYPVDEGPRPPAHPNCRSVASPVLKSWDELAEPGALKPGRGSTSIDTLAARELRRQGKTPDQIARILRGTRASMTGQVPANVTYNAWLKRQPASFVDDVLGPTKAQLFRQGKLHLDRFVDLRTGEALTLDEIRRRNPAVWARVFDDGGSTGGAGGAAVGIGEIPITARPIWGDVHPDEIALHDQALADAPSSAIGVIERTPPLSGGVRREGGGAYYLPGTGNRYINMDDVAYRPDGKLTRGGMSTWRHEYGHHVDLHRVTNAADPKQYGQLAVAGRQEDIAKETYHRLTGAKAARRLDDEGFAPLKRVFDDLDEPILDIPSASDLDDAFRQIGFDMTSTDDLARWVGYRDWDQVRNLVSTKPGVGGMINDHLERMARGYVDGDARMFMQHWIDLHRELGWLGGDTISRESIIGAHREMMHFSDLLGSITDNRVARGHGRDYYRQFPALWEGSDLTQMHMAETFANWFAMRSAPDPMLHRLVERWIPELDRAWRDATGWDG